ncbi:MAG: hydantoinase/oxoprolinase N-terminal domain-containing protein [Methylomicrobium sp.]
MRRWQFWIDRGGTFTDLVALNPEGHIVTHKLLSENPERYRDAALQGMRDILQIPPDAPLAESIDMASKWVLRSARTRCSNVKEQKSPWRSRAA